MAVQNPNWPLVDEAISFTTGPKGDGYSSHWLSIKERTEGSWSMPTPRGKQYETDQYQTAQASTVFENNDGNFTPGNTSSEYYPMVVPFRGYRRRCQFPATINILTNDQATAGTVSGFVSGTTLPTDVVAASSYPVTIVAGSPNVYSIALPSSPTSGVGLFQVSGWSVPGFRSGGTADTITIQAKVTATVSTSLKLTAIWTDVNGNTISNPSGTPATVTTAQVITITATPPVNAAGGVFNLTLNSSPGSTCTVTATSLQVERNTSASTFVQPNPWYPIFSGLTYQYPQDYIDSGTWTQTTLGCVDIYGWLSQRQIVSPAYMEILATSPAYLYCLDEPSTATAFLDATGQQPSIGFANRGVRTSGFTASFGASIEYLNNPPYGISGPVAEIDQPGTGSGSLVLNMGATSGVVPPVAGNWTRMFAVNASASTAGGNVVMWLLSQGITLTGSSAPGTTYIELGAGPATGGTVQFVCSIGGSLLFSEFVVNSPVVTDGNWHIIAVTMAANGLEAELYVDGSLWQNQIVATDMRFNATGWTDIMGTADVSNSIQYSCIAQWDSVLSGTQIGLIASTFLDGGSGFGTASSASRFQDILRWATYNGFQAVDDFASGETVAYGPATELQATRVSAGTDAVSALQTVVDTENGVQYVTGDQFGSPIVTLKARRDRYNPGTPSVVFGENTAGGEIPYTSLPFEFDPVHIANDSQITQTLTQSVIEFINQTSVSNDGNYPLTRAVNTLNLYECSDAAQFLVGQYANPVQRIQRIVINPSRSTTAGAFSASSWTACLGLEIGDYVQVNRRPPLAPEIQFLGFVESIAWTFDDQTNATVTLQISPAILTAFWEVSSSHTTVHTSSIIGATSLVINPLPDSATNPIQANISTAGNAYNWIIDYGLSTAEYVSVLSATPGSSGYSTATLQIGGCYNLATNASGPGFQYAHSSGAVLQDIGGIIQTAGWTGVGQLAPFLNPAGALDQYSTLGSTTIVGY